MNFDHADFYRIGFELLLIVGGAFLGFMLGKNR
jgi:hypothetical protein